MSSRLSTAQWRAIRFLLSLLVLLLATAWAPAPQGDEVVVVGQVTNLTADGAAPAGLPVTLQVYSGVEESESHTTTTADDGSFRFDGLGPEQGFVFAARVEYQDVVYESELLGLEPGQDELALPVSVFEVTDDASAIAIAQLHFFISTTEQSAQITELHLISNTGDRTYVGANDVETGQRSTLSFTVPDGAGRVSFDDPDWEERYLSGPGGFLDTEPVLPGTATVEVVFSYELPLEDGTPVERTFGAPVGSVVLVLSGEGVALEGDGLTASGTLDTQMGPALSYGAGPLAMGEPLTFSFVNRSASLAEASGGAEPAAAKAAGRNPVGETSIGLVSLALAVVVAYLVWRSPPAEPVPPRARPIVVAIGALMEDFEAGNMKRETYRRRRRVLKRRLRAVLADRSHVDD